MDPQAALDAPRSFAEQGSCELERGYAPEVAPRACDMGHDGRGAGGPIGGAQAILIHENGNARRRLGPAQGRLRDRLLVALSRARQPRSRIGMAAAAEAVSVGIRRVDRVEAARANRRGSGRAARPPARCPLSTESLSAFRKCVSSGSRPPAPGRARALEPRLGDIEHGRAPARASTRRPPRPGARRRRPRRGVVRASARPSPSQVPGRVEGALVVDQPDPEGGQRAEPAPRPAIGAAHLDEFLDPRLGEGRGQVIRPVRQRRPSPGSAGSRPFRKSRKDWPSASIYCPSR